MTIINPNSLVPVNKGMENYFVNSIVPQLLVDANMILQNFTAPAGKIFSITGEDIGKSIFQIKEKIGHYALVENIRGVMLIERNMENKIRARDGRMFHMNIQPCFCPEEDQINGVLVTYLDLTGQAAAMKEMEKLNAEHETLMFALSHEIKQPLSTIVLLKDALQEAFKNQDSFLFKKWIGDLYRTSKNIKVLIDQITEPDLPADPNAQAEEMVNMEEVFKEVLSMLREEIRNDNVTIEIDFGVRHIKFPRKNLRSIIYNLLGNAIKYKREDTNLEITLQSRCEDHYVLLEVKDNGIGISAEDQRSIFEKSARFNKNIEGTRMGLYIIKSMMENNGGLIEVESNPDKGSNFKLYFRE